MLFQPWKSDDTIFIQIDAHAQIDAHPPQQQALSTKKMVKSMIWVSEMHGFEVRFLAHHYAPTSCLAHA